MFLSGGFLSFVWGFAVTELKSVRARACFQSYSSSSSVGVGMWIGIFSPLFIGFGALTGTIRIRVS